MTGERPHVLYRMLNSDDELLYVGISVDFAGRMRGHRSDKTWWAEISTIRLEHYPDKASVLAAERVAIDLERPAYNVSGSYVDNAELDKMFDKMFAEDDA